MKIIKKPIIPIQTCSYCGCVFKPKYRDIKSLTKVFVKDSVWCPFCKTIIVVKFEVENGR